MRGGADEGVLSGSSTLARLRGRSAVSASASASTGVNEGEESRPRRFWGERWTRGVLAEGEGWGIIGV